MEHALVRRDVRMLHDPMRSQSRAYTAGLILGVVGLAGCAVLALLKPQGSIGDSKILMSKDSGQIYVVIDGTVHPALNLASARLAVGDPTSPAGIKESQLSSKPMGPLIGIPGAPSSLNFDASGAGHTWSACDEVKNDGSGTVTNTVIAGTPVLGGKTATTLDQGKALLVQGKDSAYLIYDNKRAAVDMSDTGRPVTDALHIRGITPRPISQALLDAIPEVLPITPPKITDPGGIPLAPALSDHRIGDVVHLTTDPSQNFVVLREGLQPISPLTADVIRNSNSALGGGEIQPFVHSNADIVNILPVGDFPATAPTIVDPKDAPVDCLSWKPLNISSTDTTVGAKHAQLSLLTGNALPIPTDAKPTRLAQADVGDHTGPTATQQFYSTPGSGMLVQTTGIEPDSQRKDSTFFIADTGVRYGIKDTEAAKALGMDSAKAKPEPAPWPIVGLIAPGPTLSRTDAMVAHDGVSPDANPAKTLVTSVPASN